MYMIDDLFVYVVKCGVIGRVILPKHSGRANNALGNMAFKSSTISVSYASVVVRYTNVCRMP